MTEVAMTIYDKSGKSMSATEEVSMSCMIRAVYKIMLSRRVLGVYQATEENKVRLSLRFVEFDCECHMSIILGPNS